MSNGTLLFVDTPHYSSRLITLPQLEEAQSLSYTSLSFGNWDFCIGYMLLDAILLVQAASAS